MWAPQGTLLWQMPREGRTQIQYCAHRKGRTALPVLAWNIPDSQQEESRMNGTEGATLGAIIEGIKNTTIETAAEEIKNTPAPKNRKRECLQRQRLQQQRPQQQRLQPQRLQPQRLLR